MSLKIKYILPLILFLSLVAYSNYLDNALIEASSNGNLTEVKTLIKNDANVNAKDNVGGTALIYASEDGHTEIVKLLKDAGAKE